MYKTLLFIASDYLLIQKSQWMDQGNLEDLQWRRLKKILSHAYNKTSFYRKRFEQAGIRPKDIKNKSDLKKIPLTTRKDLNNAKPLISSAYQEKKLKYSMTSGSSGRRTTTYFDHSGWIKAKILLKLRARLACGLKPWDKIAVFSETEANNSFLKELFLRQKSFSILDPPESHHSMLEEYQPTAMYGFPSAFANLAGENLRIHPNLIFTSSEMLDLNTKTKMEQAFNSEIFDVYGCTEVKEISWECPEHQGYHINSDWLVVEFVENSGPAYQGTYSVVVTSLYNYGMPLIRYEIGDTGEPLKDKCPCGRGLPLMRPSLGRSVDYFKLSDGTLVSPYKMTCAIEKIDGMEKYQISQESIDKIVVKIVPQENFGEESMAAITASLQEVLPGTNIYIKQVKYIPKEKSGKYKIVVSHISE